MYVCVGGVNAATGIDRQAMKDTIYSSQLQAAAAASSNDPDYLDYHSSSSLSSYEKGGRLPPLIDDNSGKYANVVSNETIQKNLQYSLDVLSEDRGHHTKRLEQLNKEIEDHMKWKQENQPILDVHIERYVSYRIVSYPNIHTYIHIYIYTYLHTSLHIHTYTYIHTYIYIHTYTHIYICKH